MTTLTMILKNWHNIFVEGRGWRVRSSLWNSSDMPGRCEHTGDAECCGRYGESLHERRNSSVKAHACRAAWGLYDDR